MSEFDDYLARIRSALDVKPRRADEICAEVRTHLEERAAQLVESGMSRDEAVARAVQTFGDPQDVARRLTQANQSHREVSAARLVFSFAVALVGMRAVGGFVDLRHSWVSAASRWVGAVQPPWDLGLLIVIVAVLMAPVMLVAGMAAGRRHWWIAFLPPALWGLTLLALAIGLREPPSYYLIPAALAIFVAAPLAAAFAFLGSRLRRRSLRCAAATLGAAYVGVLLVTTALHQSRYTVASEAWLLANIAAVAWLLVLAPGTALLWQWGKPPRRAAIVATAACAVLLFALLDSLVGVDETVFLRSQWTWMLRGIVAAQSAMAIALGGAALARKRTVHRNSEKARLAC